MPRTNFTIDLQRPTENSATKYCYFRSCG